jgi:hypothetical protein
MVMSRVAIRLWLIREPCQCHLTLGDGKGKARRRPTVRDGERPETTERGRMSTYSSPTVCEPAGPSHQTL